MPDPKPRPTHGAAERTAADLPAPSRKPTAESQKEQIHAHIRGLHATHLLSFGHDTGAFQQLLNAEPHGLNCEELAQHMGWVEAYTRSFLEAAYALGVLELASDAGVTPRARYRFAPFMAEILADESSRHHLGENARLNVLAAADYARWPDIYRQGKTFPWALHSEAFLRSAAVATRSLPDEWIAESLPRLPELRKRLEAGAHVLDVGCGAGWSLVRLAEAFPKCRLVGIDAEPNAVEMARTLIVVRNLQTRADVRLVEGEAIEYEGEFDVATLFLVLHTIPPGNRRPALDHVRRALKRGGLLVVLEAAYPETEAEFRRPGRMDTVVAQWTEAPWGHRFGTPAATRGLLEDAGFKLRETFDAGRHVVYVAEKQ